MTTASTRRWASCPCRPAFSTGCEASRWPATRTSTTPSATCPSRWDSCRNCEAFRGPTMTAWMRPSATFRSRWGCRRPGSGGWPGRSGWCAWSNWRRRPPCCWPSPASISATGWPAWWPIEGPFLPVGNPLRRSRRPSSRCAAGRTAVGLVDRRRRPGPDRGAVLARRRAQDRPLAARLAARPRKSRPCRSRGGAFQRRSAGGDQPLALGLRERGGRPAAQGGGAGSARHGLAFMPGGELCLLVEIPRPSLRFAGGRSALAVHGGAIGRGRPKLRAGQALPEQQGTAAAGPRADRRLPGRGGLRFPPAGSRGPGTLAGCRAVPLRRRRPVPAASRRAGRSCPRPSAAARPPRLGRRHLGQHALERLPGHGSPGVEGLDRPARRRRSALAGRLRRRRPRGDRGRGAGRGPPVRGRRGVARGTGIEQSARWAEQGLRPGPAALGGRGPRRPRRARDRQHGGPGPRVGFAASSSSWPRRPAMARPCTSSI